MTPWARRDARWLPRTSSNHPTTYVRLLDSPDNQSVSDHRKARRAIQPGSAQKPRGSSKRSPESNSHPPADAPLDGVSRIAPADALSDVVERVVSRRQFQPVDGDVVIRRERVPRLNPRAQFPQPWRYRGEMGERPKFTSFPHAASEAEQIASERAARVIIIEDDVPIVLADYRR
jgi:hypothetical protein